MRVPSGHVGQETNTIMQLLKIWSNKDTFQSLCVDGLSDADVRPLLISVVSAGVVKVGTRCVASTCVSVF